jgi:hypothetical protein
MSDRDGFAEQLDDLLVPWPFEEIANFLDAGDGVVVDDHPECAGVVKIDEIGELLGLSPGVEVALGNGGRVFQPCVQIGPVALERAVVDLRVLVDALLENFVDQGVGMVKLRGVRGGRERGGQADQQGRSQRRSNQPPWFQVFR